MRALVLALAFVSTPALAAPLSSTEASLHLGAYASGVAIDSADTTSALVLADLGGRWLRGPLVLDGFASTSLPVGPTPIATSYLLVARAGVSFTHVTALVGAAYQLAPGTPATQLLPSLTVEAGNAKWRGVLGLNDRSTPELLRLGVEYERYSLSYVPALGLEATARLPLRGPWLLDLRGYAYSGLLGAESLGLVAGVVWAPGEAR